MIKKYKVENPWYNDWFCSIEIDEEFVIDGMSQAGDTNTPYTTIDAMRNMILFWTGGKERLFLNNHNVTKTFLQQLAREILIIVIGGNSSVKSVQNEFKNREGWSDIDGSFGIRLFYIETLDIDYSDFKIEEVS
jgi:hypothetical protein